MQIPTALFASSGGSDSSIASSLPVSSDPLIMAMRPNGRSLATYRVSPDGTRDYTTLSAAIAAAQSLQSATRIAEGNPVLTPNYRVDIVVYPGTYVEEIYASPFIAFYGAGARGDAVLHQEVNLVDPLLGVVATNGNTYWENIDIVMDYQAVYTGGSPKYPIHAVNGGTNIYANCTMDSQKSSTATPFGMDGIDGGTTLIYNCELKPGNLNCHGWDYTRVPQTMMYVKCTAQGIVNWNALNNIAIDHLWVIEGNVFGVSLEGTASKLHLDPATIVGAGGVVSPSTDSNTSWPIPYGGYSAADRLYWGLP